ncbi:MAG: hypothetical protein LBC75_07270 [Fibromonadaceae bacterium]|jgi:uncharacterized protein (TIGR02145 family)|nr:hypothetical protein [Fibromonadaceae bacterium]
MVLRFSLLASVFLSVSCVTIERDHPDDPKSKNYRAGVSSETVSSSSSVPSSSSAPTLTIIPGPIIPPPGVGWKTFVIGKQIWMDRNLNEAVAGSKCGSVSTLSDTNTETCDIYGRLYTWATAMDLPESCNTSSCASQIKAKHQGICPSGFHIPSADEWRTLIDFVGGTDIAGAKLKATDGWRYSINSKGTDEVGFSALPGGEGDIGVWAAGYSFHGVREFGYWWSASEWDDNRVIEFSISYDNDRASVALPSESSYVSFKGNFFQSVRCLYDDNY